MKIINKLLPYKPAEVRTAVQCALASAERAVWAALEAGMMLAEVKASLGHGEWLPWLAQHCPEITEDRAERWMRAAATAAIRAGIQTGSFTIPFSKVLSLPPEKMTNEEQEARQLFLDFTSNKTLKDCLAGVIVEGDEPHRIVRSSNGKQLGGTRGEDRKDFPKFISEKLSDCTSHLRHHLTPAQRTAIGSAFDRSIQRWPRWLNELIAEYVRRENRLDDAERAAREK